MTSFNINTFRSIVGVNNEFLHTNKFMVQFPAPSGVILEDERILTFYCKSAVLPGIGILTSDVKPYGIGPVERHPHSAVVNDALFQFYMDGDGKMRQWIVGWMNTIMYPSSENGINTVGPRGVAPYEMAYREQYVTDITITIFDAEGNEKIKTTLVEAYPNYVGDISTDWQEKNSLITMPVSFTYRDWYDSTAPVRTTPIRA
jgi:hypothetical protein